MHWWPNFERCTKCFNDIYTHFLSIGQNFIANTFLLLYDSVSFVFFHCQIITFSRLYTRKFWSFYNLESKCKYLSWNETRSVTYHISYLLQWSLRKRYSLLWSVYINWTSMINQLWMSISWYKWTENENTKYGI